MRSWWSSCWLSGVAGDRPELVDGAVDQPVHGAVRRELVEGDVEAGAIRRVPANMLRETDAPPKPGRLSSTPW